MAGTQISKERLDAIIAAYGADPARWPEAEREGALKLLQSSTERGTALHDAADLDASLESAAQPEPSNILKARLLEDASRAIVSSRNTAGAQEQSGLRGLAGLIEWFADIIATPVTLKPVAVAGLMAPVLALGMWVGVSLTSESLGDEELFAAFGEDFELWTEGELSEPFDPSSELTGETG